MSLHALSAAAFAPRSTARASRAAARIRLLASLIALPLLASCSSSSTPTTPTLAPADIPGPTSLFAAASTDALVGEHFLDQPFPSDERRDADGHIVVTGFYNPRKNPIVNLYINSLKGLLDGFSPAAAAYLRFSGILDDTTLPHDSATTVTAASAIQLIDIDPNSPEHGQRRPIDVFYRAEQGTFWLPSTLAVMPLPGAPLRPKTKYAIVVTKKVHGAGSGSVQASATLKQVLGIDPAGMPAALSASYTGVADALAAASVPRDQIAHLTVFTTNDPTAELFQIADKLKTEVDAPKAAAAAWVAKDDKAAYEVYEGAYGPTPNYQAGVPPYTNDGGGFAIENGSPKLQNVFDVRFALAVPKAANCPMPDAGYPVVIYAHGTGGDYRSFLDDSTANHMALKCMASIGTDQIFHGTRPGAPALDDPNREQTIQLSFFNLNNPAAARTNNRQSGIDVMQEARLFVESNLEVPATLARGGKSLKFDKDKLLFFGHSQGGLNGPLYLASDPSSRGGVLSGAGSMITISLLEKTQPTPSVAGIVKLLLGLSSAADSTELNLFHPVINLAQTIVDTTDPLHYMTYIQKTPRKGFAAKSVLMTEGIAADGSGDHFAPPRGIEVGSLAMGLPRLAPGTREIRGASVLGLQDLAASTSGVSGNLAGGTATGAIAQFDPGKGEGHYVVFNVLAASTLATNFCQDLAADRKGRIRFP